MKFKRNGSICSAQLMFLMFIGLENVISHLYKSRLSKSRLPIPIRVNPYFEWNSHQFAFETTIPIRQLLK